VLLAILTFLPFTAPFSSCPLSLLLSKQAPAAGTTTFRSSAHDEAPPTDAFSVQIEEQLKDDAVVQAVSEFRADAVITVDTQQSVALGVSVTPFAPLVLRV
jgi:hypothetical protein